MVYSAERKTGILACLSICQEHWATKRSNLKLAIFLSPLSVRIHGDNILPFLALIFTPVCAMPYSHTCWFCSALMHRNCRPIKAIYERARTIPSPTAFSFLIPVFGHLLLMAWDTPGFIFKVRSVLLCSVKICLIFADIAR